LVPLPASEVCDLCAEKMVLVLELIKRASEGGMVKTWGLIAWDEPWRSGRILASIEMGGTSVNGASLPKIADPARTSKMKLIAIEFRNIMYLTIVRTYLR
jgi:hypothetical protein